MQVERLPHGGSTERDLWLWHLGPQPADPVLLWTAYMRRFDQEHFHRFVKGHLGLGAARLDAAEAVDRWIALVLAAYTQLYLARHPVDDLRRPWQARMPHGTTLSPYRVRLGFHRLRAKLPAITSPRNPGPQDPAAPKAHGTDRNIPAPPTDLRPALLTRRDRELKMQGFRNADNQRLRTRCVTTRRARRHLRS
ncbi:hypothetical protein [Streptomyces marianii]|uniref:Transposase n=1 Tax=Streptomyces marianii TaxID=1817406 RepID=A0A5R9EHF6_9ACTN|nr:hypothetical protein [Streptomyces marianii]TLQ47254.1 hypothetical protein FEF34_33705 [Streptomyces marianii]